MQWAICTAVDDRAATCTSLVDAGQSGISLVDSLSPRHTHEFTAYLEHAVDGTRAGTVTATFTVASPDVPHCDYLSGQVGDPTNAGNAETKNDKDSSTSTFGLRNAFLDYAASTAKAFAFNGACKTQLGALKEPQGLCDLDDNRNAGTVNTSAHRGDRGSSLAESLELPRGAWFDPRASAGQHQALLAHLVRSTEGSVLELGIGDAAASTPLLRALLGVANGATAAPDCGESDSLISKTSGSDSDDMESMSHNGSTGGYGSHVERRILVTVDDDPIALQAAMQRLPPTPNHLYALLKLHSPLDRQTGAHWDRFFALPDEGHVNNENDSWGDLEIFSCSSTKRDRNGDFNENFETVSTWTDLAARLGIDDVSVALLALNSRRGRTQALSKLAHSTNYFVLPDSVPPPQPQLLPKASRESSIDENAPAKTSKSAFWKSWRKVGVYEDSIRCKGGPTTIVLTNRSHCGLPSGPEAWHQPVLNEVDEACDQALSTTQAEQRVDSSVEHSTIKSTYYAFGQESFPCYSFDFGVLSLKVALMNEQTIALDLPVKSLLPYDALYAEIVPQFIDVCKGVSGLAQSVEECALDLFNQTNRIVSNVCSEAFPNGPPSKPPLYISIGTNCAAPSFLRAIGLRKFASPFDWTITPMESVLSVLLGERQSLTGGIRKSISSDIDINYTDPNQHTTDFFIGVPYAADLKMLFVHEDSFEEVTSKSNRRLKRMMSQIYDPPDEGVVLVYHVSMTSPQLDWPTNASTAHAIQGIHKFAENHSNIKATSLVSLLPDLLSWCYQTCEKQKQISSALIARRFGRNAVLGGDSKEEVLRMKMKELDRDADSACGWLNTSRTDYLRTIARYPRQSNFLRLLFEV